MTRCEVNRAFDELTENSQRPERACQRGQQRTTRPVLTRRTTLTLLAMAAERAIGAEPTTFILVPGAWHGAWAFSRVAPLLERAGHRVEAVTLPGLAERKEALSTAHLDDHVADVVARLERASNVVLLGHSYAGVVVMPAAARAPHRVKRLVLLDAFIAEPGKSMLAMMKPSYSESWRVKAKAVSKGVWVPPMLDAKAMGVTDPKDVKWVDSMLTPHPMATLEEAASFDPAALKGLEKRFLWCARYAGFKRYAELARQAGWDVRELDAGHDAMITAPQVVAAELT